MKIVRDFADVVMVGGYDHMIRVPMGGYTAEYILPNAFCRSLQERRMCQPVNHGLKGCDHLWLLEWGGHSGCL